MSGSLIFVGLFAVMSVVTCVLAIWRVANAPAAKYKPLWIIGSLFGFVGFASSSDYNGDLYLQFGIQIPVLILWMTSSGDLVLKALFPIVAAVALVKFHPPTRHSTD